MEYVVLVYTTQGNSAFSSRWSASSEVISQVLFTLFTPSIDYFFVNYYRYSSFWRYLFNLCGIYQNSYSPQCRWIIVNYMKELNWSLKTYCWIYQELKGFKNSPIWNKSNFSIWNSLNKGLVWASNVFLEMKRTTIWSIIIRFKFVG